MVTLIAQGHDAPQIQEKSFATTGKVPHFLRRFSCLPSLFPLFLLFKILSLVASPHRAIRRYGVFACGELLAAEEIINLHVGVRLGNCRRFAQQ
jgi:hypothetical protein